MSLITGSPLDYGIFRGRFTGLTYSVGANVTTVYPVPLAMNNTLTQFAQKNGNNIEITKSGKYQVFLKLWFAFSSDISGGAGGPHFVKLEFEKNGSILKQLNYSKASLAWVSQVNDFFTELGWGFNAGSSTGSLLTTATGSVSATCYFIANDYYDLLSGDVLSLTLSTRTSLGATYNLNNVEIVINEVKY